MFPSRFFPNRYFAPRYFCKAVIVVNVTGTGGLVYLFSLSGDGTSSGAVTGTGNLTYYFYFSLTGGTGKIYYNLSELKYLRRYLNDPTKVGM